MILLEMGKETDVTLGQVNYLDLQFICGIFIIAILNNITTDRE